MKKSLKQDRDQGNKSENGNKLENGIKDEAQGLLNVERKIILRYLLSLFWMQSE